MPVCQQCRIDMILDRIIPCAADYDMWSYICSECSGVFSMVEPQSADRTLVDERRVVLRHAVVTPATIAAGQARTRSRRCSPSTRPERSRPGL